jgi:three-Cys-motif partner protein
MPTENSSPEKWRLRRNKQVKHDILSEYLKRFIAVLSGGSRHAGPRTLHYVDSIAGRGRYSEGEPGSPLIAMEIGQELSDFREGGVYLNCYDVSEAFRLQRVLPQSQVH